MASATRFSASAGVAAIPAAIRQAMAPASTREAMPMD